MKAFQVAVLFCGFLFFCAQSFAEKLTAADDTLLEDLGAELLWPTTEKPIAPLDDRHVEQQGEQLGKDLSEDLSPAEDWLSKVVGHMQTAQALLEQSKQPRGASSAQSEALTSLDALIAELTQRQSQCKGGQCKAGNCKKPGAPKPGKKKPGSSKKAGKSPATSAPTSTNPDADLSTELAVAGQLVKDLWGQLPERQRQQILQPLSEEFLPKYATEIEAYFRDLAEPGRLSLESP